MSTTYTGPRCPGPSTADLIRADGDDNPARLTEESFVELGDADIPYSRYFDPAFFDAEMRHMWAKTWQWACRLEQIPESGDYVVYDIGRWSVLVVRGNDGEVRAFHNSCMHRGTSFRPAGDIGTTQSWRCPYHGWTYSLDGKLQVVPCRWDFPQVDQGFDLKPVRCELWGGFAFINLDPDAPPLAEFLAPLPEHLRDGWDLSQRHVCLHIEKELPGNWKAAIEAFLEAYHVVETHADYLPVVADANAQYDVWGPHVSRFVHTQGIPSPHYEVPQTQQQILDRMVVAPPGTTVPEGRTARSVAADVLKRTLGEAWGVPLDHYTVSEMMDSIEYFLFPNACLFPGVTLPMVYRFRPVGEDASKAIFDLLFLQPLAAGQAAPRAPDPVRIGVDESFMSVAGMNRTLAHIYDQDTTNLKLQWQGVRASAKEGQTLGRYQEIRIRHLHRTIDEYLARG
jgi:phenylpropionate dioxygenase-like ring-hydroxylating dioxygenase large terminal subunit